MLQPPEGVPDWAEVWSQVAGSELADSWNLGEINTTTVMSIIAARLRVPLQQVADHESGAGVDELEAERSRALAQASEDARALLSVVCGGELVVVR